MMLKWIKKHVLFFKLFNIMEQPKGLIVVAEERSQDILIKYVCWMTLMIIFVLFLLWFSEFFAHPSCDLAIEHTYRDNWA